MDQKFFPIKTNTACQLKWSWSTIRLYDGTTSSCHRVNSDFITPANFDSFHNTEKKLADRRLMLEGQWPTGGCEYCANIERNGGFSDRQLHLSIPDMYPQELDQDPTRTSVSPTIVEVYFDNVCNMACLYCWDGFSSKIYQENKKFGRFEKQGVVIQNSSERISNYDQLLGKFWEWLGSNHPSVKRFHVLGGEPFFQPQFDQCLDFFEKYPCPDLEFNVISNLKIDTTKLAKTIDRIKNLVQNNKIRRFDLTASIDCFGPEQEYVRYGLDLEQWKRNFLLLSQYKWITLNVNQTISALTIKTMPELIGFVNEVRKIRPIGHYFSLVVFTYSFLHPKIFGPGFFTKDLDDVLREMPDDSIWHKRAKQYMQGIKKEIDSGTREQDNINRLGVYLDEIDRRRNLDWRKTFPWLEQEIENVV